MLSALKKDEMPGSPSQTHQLLFSCPVPVPEGREGKGNSPFRELFSHFSGSGSGNSKVSNFHKRGEVPCAIPQHSKRNRTGDGALDVADSSSPKSTLRDYPSHSHGRNDPASTNARDEVAVDDDGGGNGKNEKQELAAASAAVSDSSRLMFVNSFAVWPTPISESSAGESVARVSSNWQASSSEFSPNDTGRDLLRPAPVVGNQQQLLLRFGSGVAPPFGFEAGGESEILANPVLGFAAQPPAEDAASDCLDFGTTNQESDCVNSFDAVFAQRLPDDQPQPFRWNARAKSGDGESARERKSCDTDSVLTLENGASRGNEAPSFGNGAQNQDSGGPQSESGSSSKSPFNIVNCELEAFGRAVSFDPLPADAGVPSAILREISEVVEKMVRDFGSDGAGSAQFQLNLGEQLGQLTVSVIIVGAEVSIGFQVKNEDVRQLLAQQIPVLQRALEERGISLPIVNITNFGANGGGTATGNGGSDNLDRQREEQVAAISNAKVLSSSKFPTVWQRA